MSIRDARMSGGASNAAGRLAARLLDLAGGAQPRFLVAHVGDDLEDLVEFERLAEGAHLRARNARGDVLDDVLVAAAALELALDERRALGAAPAAAVAEGAALPETVPCRRRSPRRRPRTRSPRSSTQASSTSAPRTAGAASHTPQSAAASMKRERRAVIRGIPFVIRPWAACRGFRRRSRFRPSRPTRSAP